MDNLQVAPVVAGLGAGIAFTVVFLAFSEYVPYGLPAAPVPPLTANQLKLTDNVTEESKVVRVFLAKFPMASLLVEPTSTCINGCMEHPPLVKNGTIIRWDTPETVALYNNVTFPRRVHHEWYMRVQLDAQNKIEYVELLCGVSIEEGGGMSVGYFERAAMQLFQNPNWVNNCSG